jgi:hypothetical protein
MTVGRSGQTTHAVSNSLKEVVSSSPEKRLGLAMHMVTVLLEKVSPIRSSLTPVEW